MTRRSCHRGSFDAPAQRPAPEHRVVSAWRARAPQRALAQHQHDEQAEHRDRRGHRGTRCSASAPPRPRRRRARPRAARRATPGSPAGSRRRRSAPPAGTSRGSHRSSRLAKMAPNSATPAEPPSERNRFEDAVAMPRSARSTPFWIAITSTCETIPKPRPKTARNADAVPREERGVELREQQQPERHQAEPDDREDLVAPGARDQPARDRRARRRRQQHRQQQQPRAAWRSRRSRPAGTAA